MCIAILEVSYLTESKPIVSQIRGTEVDLETTIATLKNNGQVTRIRVFRPEPAICRKAVWVEDPLENLTLTHNARSS